MPRKWMDRIPFPPLKSWGMKPLRSVPCVLLLLTLPLSAQTAMTYSSNVAVPAPSNAPAVAATPSSLQNQPLNAKPAPTPEPPEETPLSFPGSEPHVYRKAGDVELRLHVVKPPGWKASDKLPCLIAYFGGGWTHGTPKSTISWAKWAADHGMVGVAADYRTRHRHGTTPEACISDGRASVRWVQEHAAELGVDPSRIVAAGGSAGGHVAAWTAITGKGPGADDPGSPDPRPAALILFNPVTDTKDSGYGGTKRFGGSASRALACSVPDQMPGQMPPTIVFHGLVDTTVPYSNSVDFRDKLALSGNRCELVGFEGLGHSYSSSKFGAAGAAALVRTKAEMEKFLGSLGLIKPQAAAPSVPPVAQ